MATCGFVSDVVQSASKHGGDYSAFLKLIRSYVIEPPVMFVEAGDLILTAEWNDDWRAYYIVPVNTSCVNEWRGVPSNRYWRRPFRSNLAVTAEDSETTVCCDYRQYYVVVFPDLCIVEIARKWNIIQC